MIKGCRYYGWSKPANPQIGDVFIDKTINKQLIFDGNIWVESAPTIESKEKQLERELKDLKDFMSYKGIADAELEDFIASRRLAERMQVKE